MKIDLTSLSFGSSLKKGAGTPSWGTSLGQSAPEYYYVRDGYHDIITGLMYNAVPAKYVTLNLGKGGSFNIASDIEECQLTSLFQKVFINGISIGYPFIMALVKESSESHNGRRSIKYSDKYSYREGSNYYDNNHFFANARNTLHLSDFACWFIYDISIHNQDELHLSAIIVNKDKNVEYTDSAAREKEWKKLIAEKRINDLEKGKSLDSLGAILNDMYTNAPTGKQVAMIYYFVLKYGDYLVDIFSTTDVIDAAGLNSSFATELNKAYNLYRCLKENPLHRGEQQIAEDSNKKVLRNFASIKKQIAVLSYINAIKTKPFLLLAGISGTGKSRVVRELAFKSCPPELQDEKHTTPGNYCMIEVKPNWHDSTELFGYASSINKKYMVTPFMRFIVKAMQHPDTPFFVCLDEMNLAHVEQYFAEFLSVLETRKRYNDSIETSALIDAKVFKDFYKEDPSEARLITLDGTNKFGNNNISKDIFEDLGLHRSIPGKDEDGKEIKKANEKDIKIITHLLMYGMTIPENLIVVGTVNMDDTTKQFSRKVIDRAMTIEMNGGQLEDMFGNSSDLDYCEDETQILNMGNYTAKYISADDVIDNCNAVKGNNDYIKFITGKNDDGTIVQDADTLPRRLEFVNKALKDTPFEVSYRVMNELVIYLGVLLDEKGNSVTHDEFQECVNQAFDQILLMKVLPRIEGPYELFVLSNDERNLLEGKNIETKLDWLKSLTSGKSKEKLEEMIKRLERQGFTRFWP